MLGVISSSRDCCASRRVGSGRSSKCYLFRFWFSTFNIWIFWSLKVPVRTRVVWRTLHRRGKSFTPVSRVVMELSRRWREDCREETDAEREAAMAINFVKSNKGERECVRCCLFTYYGSTVYLTWDKAARKYNKAGNPNLFSSSLLPPSPPPRPTRPSHSQSATMSLLGKKFPAPIGKLCVPFFRLHGSD